jgi:FMN phosphatase YigB (HAD superfamily)
MTRPDAVLFDAADTLFRNHSLAEYLRQLGETDDPRLRADRLRQAMDTVGGRGLWPEDSATRSERWARWAQFYLLVLAETGLGRARAEDLAGEMAALTVDPRSYTAFPDVEATLRGLEASGIRTGIVSNFDPMLAGILDHLDLSRRFAVVVTSWETGFYKPDRRIFMNALVRLDVAAESSVFVGDSPYSDIGGARGAGLVPVLIDRSGNYDHQSCDAAIITSLVEILGIVK